MSFVITSPVTGAASNYLTSPTYTLTADIAPDVNGRQYAVTALGGTQPNVASHSGSKPFTITSFRPKSYKLLGSANPLTGVISNVPKNVYKFIIRKGINVTSVNAGTPPQIAIMEVSFSIPAGSEVNEPEEIQAMVSLGIGALNQIPAAIADSLISGLT